mgnify:CR=1 FL=1
MAASSKSGVRRGRSRPGRHGDSVVTLDYQVSTPGDDGYWTTNLGFSYDDVVLPLGGQSGSPIKVFCRWTGITIPAGAKITSAYVSFRFYSYYGTPPKCTLYFEDAANPSAISSVSDGDDRVKTTANIGVTGPTSGGWWNTGSIVSIIQELVDSYDYSSGAAMQMIIIGAASYGASLQYAYEDGYPAGSWAPKLHIEYASGDHRSSSFRGMFRGMFNRMR